jgi:hypothetical protein
MTLVYISWLVVTVLCAMYVYRDARRNDINAPLWTVLTVVLGIIGLAIYLIFTKPFRSLTFTTYAPMWILGVMVIFGAMGYFLKIGWLQSAPDVLLIPMLLLYYLSLAIGAIYGYLQKEETVYLMALISIGVWILGFVIGAILSLADSIMIGINLFILAVLLVLHLFQYSATKKWETRVAKLSHVGR